MNATFLTVMKTGRTYSVNACRYVGNELVVCETCCICKTTEEAEQQAAKFGQWRNLPVEK